METSPAETALVDVRPVARVGPGCKGTSFSHGADSDGDDSLEVIQAASAKVLVTPRCSSTPGVVTVPGAR